jgi:hypothetical protein
MNPELQAYLECCQLPGGPGMPEFLGYIHDHEALCICAEHVRGWLRTRRYRVLCLWGEPETYRVAWESGFPPAEGEFDSYHAAQCAAVRAALEEQK